MIQGIHLQKVHFSYQPNAPVLDDVTLSILPGEFVGIVGANGSGKTTLAKLLNGNLLPVSGSVIVGGLNTEHQEELKKIKRMISSIHADPENQLVTSTVFDELTFSLQAMEEDPSEIIQRSEDALERFSLKQYHNIHPFFLSVGEQFRLLLAVGLIRKPRYLILDETLSMMDSPTRYDFLYTLNRIRSENSLGIVLLTHRLDDLILSDRIIVLSSGKVVKDGTRSSVFSQVLQNDTWQIEAPLIYQVYEQIDPQRRQWFKIP
jgi:energy-coupling factor transport system ATP-binding protein